MRFLPGLSILPRWPMAVLGCYLAATPLPAQRLEAGVALTAAAGPYLFSRSVASTALTGSLLLAAEHWRIGVDVPMIRQDGGAVAWITGLPFPVGPSVASAIAARTGDAEVPLPASRRGTHLGDPILTAATDLVLTDDGSVRLGAEVFAKVPAAAREDGVGTGAADYGIGFNWSAMGNRSFAVADFGYWWLGDQPSLALDDLALGSFIAGQSFGEMGRFSTMVRMDATSAVTAPVDPRYSAGLGIGIAMAAREQLTVMAEVGLSETAPDWMVTARWRTGLRARGWGR